MSRGWFHARLFQGRSFKTGALTLVLLLGVSAARGATPPAAVAPSPTPTGPAIVSPQAARVLAQLAARNAALQAYTFDLHVKIAMHTFPWLQPYLIGNGSYRKPGQYTIAFRQVPALARSYQKVTGEMLDPASWPQKYDITTGQGGNGDDVELILHERVKGEITEARATIDTVTGSVKRMHFLYEHGGTIDIVQHSASIQGFVLPVEQDAEIGMPGFKATGHAFFSNYRLQVGSTAPAGTDHVVRN